MRVPRTMGRPDTLPGICSISSHCVQSISEAVSTRAMIGAPFFRLSQPPRRSKRRMFHKARDVYFALVLTCLGKIIRDLHSQPHVGAAAESFFKAQSHLRRDGASA